MGALTVTTVSMHWDVVRPWLHKGLKKVRRDWTHRFKNPADSGVSEREGAFKSMDFVSHDSLMRD